MVLQLKCLESGKILIGIEINFEFGITDGKLFYKTVSQVKKESKNP